MGLNESEPQSLFTAEVTKQTALSIYQHILEQSNYNHSAALDMVLSIKEVWDNDQSPHKKACHVYQNSFKTILPSRFGNALAFIARNHFVLKEQSKRRTLTAQGVIDTNESVKAQTAEVIDSADGVE